MIEYVKETILHFTCNMCKLWWSIAVMDDWRPKKMFCPHCGLKQTESDK